MGGPLKGLEQAAKKVFEFELADQIFGTLGTSNDLSEIESSEFSIQVEF